MGATIVLADDDEDLRGVYSQVLRLDGHEVREAKNGLEALTLIDERPPCLLILDVWMPALNGFEVVDRLKANSCCNGMKVIMLSSLEDSDTRLESFSEGVCDYWTKGLSLEDFRERIRSILQEESLLQD